VIFVFASVYMLYYIYNFPYFEQSLDHWNEIKLVMMYDAFDVLLISVCQYLLRIFASVIIKDISV
jgi:hypothetical protein